MALFQRSEAEEERGWQERIRAHCHEDGVAYPVAQAIAFVNELDAAIEFQNSVPESIRGGVPPVDWKL